MSKLSTYALATIADGDKIPFTRNPGTSPVTDNVLAEILATYIGTKLGGGAPAYGGLYVQGASTAQTGLSGTPAKLTPFDTDALSANMTSAHASDDITADVDGVYEVDISISFAGSNNSTFHIELYLNGSPTGFSGHRKISTGGDVGSFGFHGRLALVATDVLSLYASSADGGTSITVQDAQFMASRIAL
jgi:hypothetical protein